MALMAVMGAISKGKWGDVEICTVSILTRQLKNLTILSVVSATDPTNPRFVTNEYGEINSLLEVENVAHLMPA